ncbi:MAG: hypothetical protein M1831_006211 [Alyxoria varia]|nr:MAG: hypothetical protein M1831_006211 [Alyxoria varia]
MFNLQTLLLLAVAAGSATAGPLQKREVKNGEPYNCGCSARKQELVGKGANAKDIAIGLLEMGSLLDASYTYGDGKSSDAANFGLFKNNWFMIRTACSQFSGQSAEDYNNGAVLNDDDAAAIKCQHEQMDKYGDAWMAGQRYGPSGITDPNNQVVQDYKQGLAYIQGYIEEGHLTDDQATWAEVQAI